MIGVGPTSGHLVVGVLWIMGLVVTVIEMRSPSSRRATFALALGSVAAASVLGGLLWPGDSVQTIAGGGLKLDGFALFVQEFVLLCVAFSLLLGRHSDHRWQPGSDGLVLMSAAGVSLVAMAVDLMAVLVGFSVALIPLLGLAAIGSDPHGREAALKGTVMTVLGIALLGFGSSLLASRTGTTNLQGIADTLGRLEWIGSDPLMVVSLALILSGLGLFLAVVPFHMLFGDVAEGIPYPGTLLLTGGLIATGLAATTRVLLVGLGPVVDSGPGYLSWSDVLQTAGLLVLIVGNSMALVQRRLKRLLACLAAGQAGMVLVTLAAAGQLAFDDPDARLRAVAGILVFLAVHAVNWAGLFLAVGAIDTEPGGRIVGHLQGLGRKHPWLAASVALSLLCVAGMPLTAGFFARLYLLEAMVAAGWIGTAVTVALSLGIVLVLSLGLVTAMFLRPAREGVAVSGSPALSVVAWVTALTILALGLLPGGVFEVAMGAAASLF